MLNIEATCLRSRVLASAGSFRPCSPEDRCTCIRPGQSRCRWHYLRRAWTSTGGCLLFNKQNKKKKREDFSCCRFSLLLLSCFCACFRLLPPFPSSRLCSHQSILSLRGKLKTRLAQASSASASAEEKRRVSSRGGQQEKHKYVLFDEIQQVVVSKTG